MILHCGQEGIWFRYLNTCDPFDKKEATSVCRKNSILNSVTSFLPNKFVVNCVKRFWRFNQQLDFS